MSPLPRKAQTLFKERKIAVLPCSSGRDYVVGCHRQRSKPSRPAQGRDRSCKGIPQTGCACSPTRARGVCVPRTAQRGTERTLPAPTHVCTHLAALLFLSWCCHKLSYCYRDLSVLSFSILLWLGPPSCLSYGVVSSPRSDQTKNNS